MLVETMYYCYFNSQLGAQVAKESNVKNDCNTNWLTERVSTLVNQCMSARNLHSIIMFYRTGERTAQDADSFSVVQYTPLLLSNY